MTPLAWTLFALLTATAAAGVALLYRRREPDVPGRAVLLGLRVLALALLLLLLFDPRMEAPGRPRAGAAPAVVVDRSLSMALPLTPGAERTRWQAALEAVADIGPSAVLVTGDGGGPGPLAPDSLRRLAPELPTSRLSPALRAAVEAGARRVVVVTDGRLEDVAEVGRWLPATGAALEVRVVGDPLPNRWLAEIRAPGWAEPGEPVALTATVAATGTADSVTLVARRDGAVVARRTVAAPAAGRTLDVPMEAPPPRSAAGGWARYEVALEGSDAVPDDDVRTVYVRVADEPAGVALVSFRPDWEPR
ncbi:MAG TPA: VWA domain-containing protein, partial [Longimicrobiales bacterium]|nr:VWA domain-containing protein [Longimicrobiales bacterium]